MINFLYVAPNNYTQQLDPRTCLFHVRTVRCQSQRSDTKILPAVHTNSAHQQFQLAGAILAGVPCSRHLDGVAQHEMPGPLLRHPWGVPSVDMATGGCACRASALLLPCGVVPPSHGRANRVLKCSARFVCCAWAHRAPHVCGPCYFEPLLCSMPKCIRWW